MGRASPWSCRLDQCPMPNGQWQCEMNKETV
jgi:hypothetical protein